MAGGVKATTHELGDSRVRVDVEVGSDAVEQELTSAADVLGRNLKIPGFRKGKVPPRVVIQRVGREAVLDEALRHALPRWYEEAIGRAGIAAVGDPKLDLEELPGKGAPLEFSFEVGVRPPARPGRYTGLEVGRREPDPEPDEVDAELERFRESLASLETVDRAARAGDFVVLDFVGTVDGEPFEGGEARGYPLELGSGRLVPGFEDQLAGASAGEKRDVAVTFPSDYPSEPLAGKQASFAVEVKEVKEKRLPELSDAFASDAGGFESLDELREELASNVREAKTRLVEAEFREAVLDAAVGEASVELAPELVEARAKEIWRSTARGLRRRGIEPERYLQMAGKSEAELIEEAKPDAEQSLRRESVLAAIAEAERIEVSDDDLLDALRSAATGEQGDPPSEEELHKAVERARREGRDAGLREDIAMRKALDLMVAEAKPIPLDKARAREKLWTPGKGKAAKEERQAPEASPGKLWTPGS